MTVYAVRVPQASAQQGVENTLRSLASELEREVDELVEAMLVRMGDEVPDVDVDDRPELREALRGSCYGNIRAGLQALGGDREAPHTLPVEAREEARATGRAGISLTSLLHTYRVGHAVAWERLLALVGDTDLSPATRQAVLQIGSRCLFAYVDAVSGLVTEEYTQTRDRAMRSSIQRRVQLVRDVLGGAAVGSGELGYDLDAEHLAVIAEGPETESVLHALAETLERTLLTVAVGERTMWAWLGTQRRADDGLKARLTSFQPGEDASLAFGEPAWGPTGFRESHEQARAAQRVGSRTGQRIVLYDDVALEAALLADGQAARRFVQRELGPLRGGDDRSMKLLRTLEAYLSAGLNASAAGAMLGVGDRTVAYRMRAIEELLGRNVSVRSAELAAAIRLNTVFG